MKIENGMVTMTQDERTVENQIWLLKGMFTEDQNKYPLSLDALSLAVSCHKGQLREDGKPYISHPLSMACMAKGLGLRDDVLYAILLLHDVCEDCGIKIQDVSESSQVRNAVRLMTVAPFRYDLTKADVKRRYFEDLLQSREALIGKALDRIDNLESMVGVFSRERALKNWRETYYLLMPTLKRAKETLNMRDHDLLHILRGRLRSNLKWSMAYYNFTEQELYTPYGSMSFEQKPVHNESNTAEYEHSEFCEPRYSIQVPAPPQGIPDQSQVATSEPAPLRSVNAPHKEGQ